MGCSFPDVCGKKQAAILITQHLLGLGCSWEPDSTCCLLRPDFLSAHTSALSSWAESMHVTHYQLVCRGPAVISQPHPPPGFFTMGRSQMLLLRAKKSSQEQRSFQDGLSFLSTSGGCLLFEARAGSRILPCGHPSPGLTVISHFLSGMVLPQVIQGHVWGHLWLSQLGASGIGGGGARDVFKTHGALAPQRVTQCQWCPGDPAMYK